MDNLNLPIKIILQRNEDTQKNETAGGPKKIFDGYNNQKPIIIAEQLNKIAEYYSDFFEENPQCPAVAKIIMKDEAIAKSHKPSSFCVNMPIIGTGELNELYIKITMDGIKKTVSKLSKNLTNEMISNLSAIEEVLPYTSDDKKIFINTNYDITNRIKVKLFKFDNEFDDYQINVNFIKEISKIPNISYVKKEYGNNLEYFEICGVNDDKIVDRILNITGIKSLDMFYNFTTTPMTLTDKKNMFIPGNSGELGNEIIGVIDSGISEGGIFDKYIIGREVYVPSEYQNRNHGSFVASTILFGSEINERKEEKPVRFKLLDIVAIPNNNEKYGPVDSIYEDDLYDIIEECVKKHHAKVKIWNLSLGIPNKISSNSCVSDMAAFCDFIQKEYSVQFIIAAGNYRNYEFRSWPMESDLINDRITSPGDSFIGITVGSLAEKDSENSLVKKDEPSPFSRRGPGANYMMKPEVVDYGGNINKYNSIIGLGVKGLDENGNIVENIGTSFSTPCISYKYAKILNELVDKDILLAKALLIHSAKIINSNDNNIRYYGYGRPPIDVQKVLNCSENEITLIFKQTIVPGTHLEMDDFPYPQCLIKNGKYYGEIFMTLVNTPILDPKFGSEYNRVNFDASFGTYIKTPDGKKYKGQVPLDLSIEDKYERSRVENGFKWCPVKSYYRNMKNGVKLADGWKIRMNMTFRREEIKTKHEFILVITIRGNDNDLVYNDVVKELSTKGYIAINLETRNQIRERN